MSRSGRSLQIAEILEDLQYVDSDTVRGSDIREEMEEFIQDCQDRKFEETRLAFLQLIETQTKRVEAAEKAYGKSQARNRSFWALITQWEERRKSLKDPYMISVYTTQIREMYDQISYDQSEQHYKVELGELQRYRRLLESDSPKSRLEMFNLVEHQQE